MNHRLPGLLLVVGWWALAGSASAQQRTCVLRLVDQNGRLGWIVRLSAADPAIDHQESAMKARFAPLPWPATRKEAWKACERFLNRKAEVRNQKSGRKGRGKRF